MSDWPKPVTALRIWEFEKIPFELRRQIPNARSGSWIAYISSDSGDDVIQELMRIWVSSGFSVTRYEFTAGGTLLAGSPNEH